MATLRKCGGPQVPQAASDGASDSPTIGAMTDVVELQRAAAQVVAALPAAGQPLELVEQDVLGVPMLFFKNRRRSLGELLIESVRYGDRDYLVTADSRLS